MSRLGADVEALDRLARLLSVSRQSVEGMLSDIERAIASAWWEGPDAERFRQEWPTYRQRLSTLASELDESARNVQHDREAQVRASRGDR
jgi:uncharacterized protein YukE